MPMDYKYLELELDNVEARGAGRVPQEMAKNPALPGDGVISPHPEGLHPNLIEHKMNKTFHAVEARLTQVNRRKEG